MERINTTDNTRPSIMQKLHVRQKKPIYSVSYKNINGYHIFIDVETINDITKKETAYPYDIHITIIDNEGHIILSISYIVSDIFDNKVCMENCFYRNKIPYYEMILDDLNTDKEIIKLRKIYRYSTMERVLNTINRIIEKYNIKSLHAFNGKFDFEAILNLYELAKINNTPFFNLDLIDTREMFLKALIDIPKLRERYIKWCKKYGKYNPDTMNVLTNVETIMQFIMHDLNFREKHNGYSDTLNEIYIEKWIIKQYEKYHIELIINFNNYWLKGFSLYSKNGLLKIN